MKRNQEIQAVRLLERILYLINKDSDALPGSVVKLVKQARRILLKRMKRRIVKDPDWTKHV